jgi:succinoglycan biosynthesis transport protein ExoP
MGKPVKVSPPSLVPHTAAAAEVSPPRQAARREIDLAYVLHVAQRQKWWIAACVVLALAVSGYITWTTTPVYQASASIRIESKRSNLPTVMQDEDDDGGIATETVVLASRTLAEGAVSKLGLQLVVTSPSGVVRSSVLKDVTVAGRPDPRDYLLKRRSPGNFTLLDAATRATVREVVAGQPVSIDSVSFVVLPAADKYAEIGVSVAAFDDAVSWVVGALAPYQLSRDASIIVINYVSPDPELVWRVPNAIVDQYIAYRNEVHQAEARRTVHFLRGQLDSVSAQLATAEDALQQYRQRHLVISPDAAASNQVSQLAQLQAQRRDIETEHAVLTRLLDEADAKARTAKPGDASPYRELLAYPTLMRSGAANDLLSALSRKEEERSALGTQRTPDDPDLKPITERIQSLQQQIRGVVVSYLDGLSRQLTELDATQQRFGRDLSQIPQTELGLARLERQPKVLQDIYEMLQTRLKESEIAAASEDPSVRRVDPAIPQWKPIRPRPAQNLFGGASLGLVLGVAVALLREARDKSVRSRADVVDATGLPVLGLIPQIPRRGARAANLGEWKQVTGTRQSGRRHTESRPIATPGPRPFSFLPNLRSASTPGEPTPRPTAPDARPGEAGRFFTVPEANRPALEAYSALQTNLEFATAASAEGLQVLLLTSAIAGEGKTTCAGNLALALGERGRSVILLDLDLRQGRVHTFFDAPRSPGLTELLRAERTHAEVLRSVELGVDRRVDYLSSGTPPSAPLALLESLQLKDLITELRNQYDVVLLDSPPVNFVTDALVLSAYADGVIVVARSGRTGSTDLSFAIEQLVRAGAPVLGVALNDIDFRSDASYDQAYRYFVDSSYVNPRAEG